MVSGLKERIKFSIWDTAGQEKYGSLADMYYRDAGAAILVYDITRVDSYTVLQRWMKELREKGPNDIIVMIAGNKADLTEHAKVDIDKVREYANENKALLQVTSAKTNSNIDELFHTIARKRFSDPTEALLLSLLLL